MPTGHSPSPLMHQRYAVFRLLKAISITTGQPVQVSRDETITVPGLANRLDRRWKGPCETRHPVCV